MSRYVRQAGLGIAPGAGGPEVQQLQAALDRAARHQSCGFTELWVCPPGPRDDVFPCTTAQTGVFDSPTETQLRSFQKWYPGAASGPRSRRGAPLPLEPVGTVGPLTLAALADAADFYIPCGLKGPGPAKPAPPLPGETAAAPPPPALPVMPQLPVTPGWSRCPAGARCGGSALQHPVRPPRPPRPVHPTAFPGIPQAARSGAYLLAMLGGGALAALVLR